jgi:CMP-N,N'-diacetyllegionaminic acid synthase
MIVALIPARKGSKGVPGKNIKLLDGVPLIAYSIRQAIEAGLKAVVSTDSEEIATIARQFGASVPFIRPAVLAGDKTPSLGVVQHALDEIEKESGRVEAICLLQPTCPFRASDEVSSCIEKFSRHNYDALVTVRKVPDKYNPHWVFREDEAHLLKPFIGGELIPSRQLLPPSYYRDGSVYITRSEVIRAGSLLGERTGFVLNTSERYVNIDEPSDWDKAEAIAASRK